MKGRGDMVVFVVMGIVLLAILVYTFAWLNGWGPIWGQYA